MLNSKFEVYITMAVGLAEDVHYHKLQREGKDEFDVFSQIKEGNWFHYERKIVSIEKGVSTEKVFHEFIQVKNISDISIRRIS